MKKSIKNKIKGILFLLAIVVTSMVLPATLGDVEPVDDVAIEHALESMREVVYDFIDEVTLVEEDVWDVVEAFDSEFNYAVANIRAFEALFTSGTWVSFEGAISQVNQALSGEDLDMILEVSTDVIVVSYRLQFENVEEAYEEYEEESAYVGNMYQNNETDEAPTYSIEAEEPLENGIRGIVWLDEDGTGARIGDEPLLSGIIVKLYDAEDGTLIDTTQTDGQGEFVFEELSGSYIVRVESGDNNEVFDVYGIGDGSGANVPIVEDENGALIDFSEYEGLKPVYVGIMPLSNLPITVGNWADLRAAVNATTGTTAAAPRTITISDSFNTASGIPSNTAAITTPASQHVRLVSSGTSNFSLTQDTAGRHFIVGADSSLTLERITLTRSTTGAPSTTNGGGIGMGNANSRLILNNDAIIQNNRATNGGGINANGAGSQITLNEGSIVRGNFAATNGGGISVSFGTLTIQGGTISRNSVGEEVDGVGGQGGGIHAINGSTIDLIDGVIGGGDRTYANRAGHGAGIHISGLNTTLNMTGGYITNNAGQHFSSGGGGVRVVHRAVFNMRAGEISFNEGLGGGGGVQVDDHINNEPNLDGGHFNMYDGLIENNNSHFGGGVHARGEGQFTMHDGIIDNNESTDSGGGVRVILGGTFTMNGGSIFRNNTGNNGGGVSVSSNDSTFNFYGGIIGHEDPEYGNTAQNNGGGIHFPSGTINFRGSDAINILNNTATTGNGGGINWTGGTLNTTTNTGDINITDNTARENGGGIFMSTGTLNVTDGWEIANNTAMSAANGGGGIHITGNNSSLNLSGGEIHTNTANYRGGGVYLASGTFDMTAGIIRENIVLGENVAGNTLVGNGGGGVHLMGGTFTMNGTNAIIEANAADTGGGVRVQNGTFVMLDGEIRDNTNNPLTGNQVRDGGGVHVLGNGNFAMHGGVIHRNHASNGGALSVYTGGSAVMTGGEMRNNIATNGTVATFVNTVNNPSRPSFTMRMPENGEPGYGIGNHQAPIITQNRGNWGGGAHFGGGNIYLLAGEISHNTRNAADNGPVGTGGGIMVPGVSGANVMIDGTEIHDNIANNGGGIHIGGGTVTLRNGVVYNNAATNNAGGVQVNGGTFNFYDGTIGHEDPAYGNTAQNHGGGIHLASGTINFRGSDAINILNNTATTGDGGGINWIDGTLNTLDNTGSVNIIDNTAGRDGGGINMLTGALTITADWFIRSNAATRDGGGVNLLGDSELVMTGGIIGHENPEYGNRAERDGGGVRAASTSEVDLSGTAAILGNRADGNGGGLNIQSDAGISISGNTRIANNDAVTSGGGALITGRATLYMTSGRIENNSSAGGAGLFFSTNSSGEISGGIIGHENPVYGNAARNSGGGISQSNAAEVTLSGNVQIINNFAANHGGGFNISTAGTTNPTLNMTSGIVAGNEATNQGGGVHLSGGGVLNLHNGQIMDNTATTGGGIHVNADTSTLNFYGGIIGHENREYGNTAHNSGGGVHLGIGTMNFRGSDAINVLNNTATTGDGGGINWIGGAWNTIANTGDVNITGNIAGTNGGGINQRVGTLTITEGWTIDANEAFGALPSEGGGGVYLIGTNTELIMTGGVVEDNTARSGGGVYARSGAAFTMSGGIINDNEAIGGIGSGIGVGGGVRIEENSSFTMSNTARIYNNTATNYGGGVNVGIDSEFNMSGSTRIHDNSSETSGGGVSMHSDSDFIMTSGEIYDNEAAINGGGVILFSRSTFTMSNGTIENNTANGAVTSTNINRGGGGVFVTQTAEFTATGGSIINNQAPNGDGGGIFTERHNYVHIFPAGNVNNYTNLNIASPVLFTGNTARRSFIAPGNPEILTWIDFTNSSTSSITEVEGYRHWLNNYDINYQSDTVNFEFIKTDESIYDYQNTAIADVARLSGARFVLDRYTPNADNPNESGTWSRVGDTISGTNGAVQFEGEITPNTLYRLTEIEAPAGFILPEGHWYFRFNEDGTVMANYPRVGGGWALAFRHVPEYNEDGGMWFVGNMFDIELPATGGSGTFSLMLIGGSTLTLVYLLWLRKRIKLKVNEI